MGIDELAVTEDGSELRVTWRGGGSSTYHALWLRENAQDDATRHAGSGQKLVSILDLEAGTRIATAALDERGDVAVRFVPEPHLTTLPAVLLRLHASPPASRQAAGWLEPGIETWDGGLAASLPRARFADVADDEPALARWLGHVRRYGVALLTDGPSQPGTVTRVVEWFGHVRETNYGRLFDVRAEQNPSNLAYTGMGLEVHTDNPYRDPVPGLQLLHCLACETEGGQSVVVDGFRAARLLGERDPDAFARLTTTPVRFTYAAAGTHLTAKAPMIGLGADGELLDVRFNNRSLAPLDLPAAEAGAFYAAYRAFARILTRPELEVEFRLRPGDLFIVDNRRVLHGRRPCTGSGLRHLQGCYADRDGLLSRLAVLDAITGATT